jgi:hypothetical protein
MPHATFLGGGEMLITLGAPKPSNTTSSIKLVQEQQNKYYLLDNAKAQMAVDSANTGR